MEQQLKQRLAGAIVLVSLAVIFIPVILEGPNDEWTPRDHTIPEPPDLDYHTPTDLPIPVPLDEQSAEKPAVEVPTVTSPVPLPVAPEPVEQAKPPAASVTTAVRKAGLANGWYVQVGSFSQQDNARGLRDRLRSGGLDAHLQPAGAGYRVLVGPTQTRGLAEKIQKKLAGAQKLKGIVVEIGAPAG